jgi:uncharacterized membrane protein
MAKKTLKDALDRAASDQAFARQLVSNPAQFKDEYELSEEQLKSISAAGHAATKSAGGPSAQYEDGGGGGGGGGTGGGGGGNVPQQMA